MNSKAKQVSLWERIKKQKLLLLMTVPGLVLTFIFKYIPMYGVLIAFKDYNPLKGILGSDWIGFSEFTKFISSPNFGILLANTLKLSIYGLLLGFLPPIILAIMLNQLLSEKVKKRIQLILYAPNFISVVVIVGMIFLFFSVGGPINNFLSMFGMKAAGMNIIANCEEIAGQTVFHTHVHLVPRYSADDDLKIDFIAHEPDFDKLAQVAETIKNA